MEMVKFAAILPVGPGQPEVDRAADTLNSLWAYEPTLGWVVLVDDARQDRQLGQRFDPPPGCRVTSIINPRRGKGVGWSGGLCAATLAALKWVHQHTDASFVLKLDTDALVIAPFAEKIRRAFDEMPEVGMFGSYDRTCNGEARDFSRWGCVMRKFSGPIAIWLREIKKTDKPFQQNLWGRPARIRRIIKDALKNGYAYGQHCLGGAYVISAEMLRRMDRDGLLDDPLLWLHTPVGEDVMMGVYTKAVGLEMRSLVEQGEPFGLKFNGLPDTPERLLSRGYSLIHSVKNDAHFSESEIRGFYREIRAGLSSLS